MLNAVLIVVFAGAFATGSKADAQKQDIGVVVSGVVYMPASEGQNYRTKMPIAGAAVQIRDLPTGWNARPSDAPLKLAFSKGKIRPEFSCLQVGQRVVIQAPEGDMFSLRAYSPARGDFAETVPRNHKLFTDCFSKPDNLVTISCAIHPTAHAQLQVVPTPGFTLCDAEGRFRLPRKLPRGEHVLRAFYPGCGFGETAVVLQGDEGDVTVELLLFPRIIGNDSTR